MTPRLHNTLAWLCLWAAYALIVGQYALHTPLFEAPDEYHHFAVIEHLARTGTLPPLELPPQRSNYDFPSHPWRQMAFHAPLYYQLGALLIAGVDTSDFSAYRLNPHARLGDATTQDNANFIAHIAGEDTRLLGVPQRDPLEKTGEAMRRLRLLSMFLGGMTLAGVWALGRWGLPHMRGLAWWAAACLLAVPQFAFISAAVSNDNLVIALSVWTLAVCAGLMHGRLAWGVGASVLGVLLACASLAKASGLTLYPVAGALLLWRAWHTRRWLDALKWGALWACAFALIAGWWYVRNALVLGDPSASSWVARATGMRQNYDDLVGELRGLYFSFWGLFGWFNVMPPLAFYGLCTGWLGLSLVPSLTRAWSWLRHVTLAKAALPGLLAAHALLVVGAWVVFNAQVLAGQGRLFFPLLGQFGLTMAQGLLSLPRVVRRAALCLMWSVSAAMPSLVIAPAYTPQWQEAIPPDVPSFAIREAWSDEACLTLWVQSLGVQDDGMLELALFWQAECTITGY